MPEYLTPGVYVEEIPSGPVPIEGVSTSTAGFVGQAERGPTTPKLITSFTEYQRIYGGFTDPDKAQGYLPYAVQGFFANGGKRAFVARIVRTGAGKASFPVTVAAGDAPAFNVSAIGDGSWGNNLIVRVKAGAQRNGQDRPFSLTVFYNGKAGNGPTADGSAEFLDPDEPANLVMAHFRPPAAREDYPDLSTRRGATNYFETVINSASNLIRVGAGAGLANGPLDAVHRLMVPATVDLNTTTANNATVLRATSRVAGESGNAIRLQVELSGTGARRTNAVTVTLEDTSTKIEGLTPDNLVRKINEAQELVTVAWHIETGAVRPDFLAAAADQALSGGAVTDGARAGTDAQTVPLAAASPTLDRYTGAGEPALKPEERKGLAGLRAIPEISLLCIPDQGTVPNLVDPMVTQCTNLGSRFAILQFGGSAGEPQTLRPPMDSSYGAVYYPWIRILHPETGAPMLVPPCGHVAGVYARTDIERGVHKAPANETLAGPLLKNIGDKGPLAQEVSTGVQDILNPRNVNCIRDFRAEGRGVRVWGGRTMSSNGQWRYVNVRRLFIFVEQSVELGTQWVVFEPNDAYTWQRVISSVSRFLTTVWKNGALFGATPQAAFFVKCDRTTMTQDDIDNGRLICLVGIAPVKPAEFVIFRFQQKTADAPS